MTSSVAAFIDYENIRRGLLQHFQKRVPEDIPVSSLLQVIKEIASGVGGLYEAQVFGDWTVRSQDAHEIEKTPLFRAVLVLRADSKKDRTDPVMNFAIDDTIRDKPEDNTILLCSGDADFCEVVRRSVKNSKTVYVCAVGPHTAPELLSLSKAFYSIEQRLGLATSS